MNTNNTYNTRVLVVGAGIGGLGAASWLKKRHIDFLVVDGCDSLPMNLHNGVHYLHTIPSLPFETEINKITLTDAILNEGKMYDKPSLKFALQYSEKTGEMQRPSSIMSVGKYDTAYMPASNSMNSLIKEMYDFSGENNFIFGYWLTDLNIDAKIATFTNKSNKKIFVEYDYMISTVPLDKIKNFFEEEFIRNIKTECNSIYVVNYNVNGIVPNWMINIYIPDSAVPIYRASILNGICSVESTVCITDHDIHKIIDFLNMFRLSPEETSQYNWKTGKVISISIQEREKLINLLKEHSIYTIGRFGLWNRKLLMDSTINQAKAIVDHIDGTHWEDIKDLMIK